MTVGADEAEPADSSETGSQLKLWVLIPIAAVLAVAAIIIVRKKK